MQNTHFQMNNSPQNFEFGVNNRQNECEYFTNAWTQILFDNSRTIVTFHPIKLFCFVIDDAYANIYSTNLEDCLAFEERNEECEETQELIKEAMKLPKGARERRLEEIGQHSRFLQRQEAKKRILNEKKHRRKWYRCFAVVE